MARLRDFELPEIQCTGDHLALFKAITTGQLSPEELGELVVYLDRQLDRLEPLDELRTAAREALRGYFERLADTERDPIQTEAVLVTYTTPKPKPKVRDREELVENLSPEALKITYAPDVKALETLLSGAEFARFFDFVEQKPRVTVRDRRGPLETIGDE